MPPDIELLKKLSSENKRLREQLTAAEQWIGREISDMQVRRHKESVTRTVRQELVESREDIHTRIEKYFGDTIPLLGGENIDLLVDSEVNFSHIIKNKHLDGFAVTNAYQKILENIFEDTVTAVFRETYKKKRLHPRHNDLLEKTLYKVLHQNFRLSLGKIYQILERIMQGSNGGLLELFEQSLLSLPFYQILHDALFWEEFSDIIATQAFGEKRHAGKITYRDVQELRRRIVGNFAEEAFIKRIMTHIALTRE